MAAGMVQICPRHQNTREGELTVVPGTGAATWVLAVIKSNSEDDGE